jgi:RHS repeat-associated protein
LSGIASDGGIERRVTYEQNRDLISAVSNHVNHANPVLISAYDYANDAAGRRVSRNADSFTFNSRSEVIGAVIGTNDYGYAYDAIGNRVWSAANNLTNTYAANRLNQYSLISNHVNHVNPVRIHPTYDADGNMRWDGRMWHTWDAENRLVRSEPGLGGATNGSVRVVNDYDHRHRRIQKRVEVLTGRGAGYPFDPSQGGTWDVVATHTYFYDGWNLVLETVAHADGSVDRIEYVWGLDISGTLQGAGGVGGLLFEVRNGQIFIPFYDANGNVTAYVDAHGNVRGQYIYDVFGNTVSQTGDMADVFHFRFSTKYWDEETRSYYYGYRHYAPKLGCWFNRDPIGINGGLNEYGFVGNDPANKNDVLGLACGWAVGKCTRALIIPSCPKLIMINGVPILVPDMVQQMVNSIPRLHHDDVKAVACTGKCSWGKCAGGTESVAVRGFFAKSMYDAVREKVLDLMGKSPSNGWVDGYVGYKEPGPCNLSCVSEQRYNQVIQRMNTLNPTRYKLTDYTCQTYASEVLAP